MNSCSRVIGHPCRLYLASGFGLCPEVLYSLWTELKKLCLKPFKKMKKKFCIDCGKPQRIRGNPHRICPHCHSETCYWSNYDRMLRRHAEIKLLREDCGLPAFSRHEGRPTGWFFSVLSIFNTITLHSVIHQSNTGVTQNA